MSGGIAYSSEFRFRGAVGLNTSTGIKVQLKTPSPLQPAEAVVLRQFVAPLPGAFLPMRRFDKRREASQIAQSLTVGTGPTHAPLHSQVLDVNEVTRLYTDGFFVATNYAEFVRAPTMLPAFSHNLSAAGTLQSCPPTTRKGNAPTDLPALC